MGESCSNKNVPMFYIQWYNIAVYFYDNSITISKQNVLFTFIFVFSEVSNPKVFYAVE